MKKNIGGLGRTEWVLMRICWKKGKTTAKDIYVESLKEKKRSYITVKTILDRLAKKGYLKSEKFAKTNLNVYSPKVSEKVVTNKAIDDFVTTVMNNAVAPIFVHIAKKLKNKHEIVELKKLIDKIEEEEE